MNGRKARERRRRRYLGEERAPKPAVATMTVRGSKVRSPSTFRSDRPNRDLSKFGTAEDAGIKPPPAEKPWFER